MDETMVLWGESTLPLHELDWGVDMALPDRKVDGELVGSRQVFHMMNFWGPEFRVDAPEGTK